MSGLYKNEPVVAACFAVILFSMAGIPPLAGFIGKLLILNIVIDNKKIDLPEIQSTSVQEVIEEKLNEAYKIVKEDAVQRAKEELDEDDLGHRTDTTYTIIDLLDS